MADFTYQEIMDNGGNSSDFTDYGYQSPYFNNQNYAPQGSGSNGNVMLPDGSYVDTEGRIFSSSGVMMTTDQYLKQIDPSYNGSGIPNYTAGLQGGSSVKGGMDYTIDANGNTALPGGEAFVTKDGYIVDAKGLPIPESSLWDSTTGVFSAMGSKVKDYLGSPAGLAMLQGGTSALLGYNGAKMAGNAAGNAANTAAGASDRATQANLQAQREQLAYLQDVDKMPRQYREAALAKLNATFNGPNGFQYPQEQMINNAQNSPLYNAIMGGQKAGEDSILRNQAMTGGFRSGNMQSNLNEFNTGLQNSALLTAYDEQKQNYNQGLSGLSSLAGLQGQTSNISNVMGQMGQTSAAGIMNSGNIMAQGITAQGQAQQQGLQGIGNAVGSAAGNYLYAKGKGIL